MASAIIVSKLVSFSREGDMTYSPGIEPLASRDSEAGRICVAPRLISALRVRPTPGLFGQPCSPATPLSKLPSSASFDESVTSLSVGPHGSHKACTSAGRKIIAVTNGHAEALVVVYYSKMHSDLLSYP